MRGFTLLEMGIVLVLLGFIAVLLSTPLVRAVRSETRLRAARELEHVRDALVGYAQFRRALPAALADATQAKDMFGSDITYRADSRLLSADICDGSLKAADVAELTVRTTAGDVPHVALYLGTPGRDKQRQIACEDTPIDIREPGDDLALFATWYELRARVCTANGGAG